MYKNVRKLKSRGMQVASHAYVQCTLYSVPHIAYIDYSKFAIVVDTYNG